MLYCPCCGARLVNGKCEYCGYQEEREEENPKKIIVDNYYEAPEEQEIIRGPWKNQYAGDRVSDKKRWTAFLLCLFGGLYGLHYFYLGRWKMGLLYMFTAGLIGFGWLVDIVRIYDGEIRDGKDLPLV